MGTDEEEVFNGLGRETGLDLYRSNKLLVSLTKRCQTTDNNHLSGKESVRKTLHRGKIFLTVTCHLYTTPSTDPQRL